MTLRLAMVEASAFPQVPGSTPCEHACWHCISGGCRVKCAADLWSPRMVAATHRSFVVIILIVIFCKLLPWAPLARWLHVVGGPAHGDLHV
jgi:hypothetical protein